MSRLTELEQLVMDVAEKTAEKYNTVAMSFGNNIPRIVIERIEGDVGDRVSISGEPKQVVVKFNSYALASLHEEDNYLNYDEWKSYAATYLIDILGDAAWMSVLAASSKIKNSYADHFTSYLRDIKYLAEEFLGLQYDYMKKTLIGKTVSKLMGEESDE